VYGLDLDHRRPCSPSPLRQLVGVLEQVVAAAGKLVVAEVVVLEVDEQQRRGHGTMMRFMAGTRS
jgi:hypothetical protein